MSSVTIRRALLADAEIITKLIFQAKQSWGYSDAFMDACRAELRMTLQKIDSCLVWVAEKDGVICGVICLCDTGDTGARLEDLFVDPTSQHQGIGRMLLETLLAECKTLGIGEITLDADPNAEQIYRKFGFTTALRKRSEQSPAYEPLLRDR